MTMSETDGDGPRTARSEEDRVMDAAVDEVERRARAREDADAEERVAVRDDDGRITEERAQ
ncbi:hypothetical protein [Agromyces sp. M3QZ16-3]|uniref:hypothetical protein n=1 Tax=Agromyces sp. M3QZ16-3 TaxID=3447585 RepID=UPI003F68E2AA